MPVIESTYKPPFWAKNGNVATVYSGLIRKVKGLAQQRERLNLADGDFMDLDWSYTSQPTRSVIILLHGLEGHAQRPYITGSAKLFNEGGIDAVGVNFRGCSGEPNRLYRSYHSGATEDLHAVVEHVLSLDRYDQLYIKGISLGANMALKYVGEGNTLASQIKAVIAVSAPCDLKGSCDALQSLKNRPYAIRFLDHLKKKLQPKLIQFPDQLSKHDYDAIKTLIDFDDVYTAKAHGFKDAYDYYHQCSSRQFLPEVKIPSLIINALNDSFLTPSCFPVKEGKENPQIYLEMPKYGGHVGFITSRGFYYNEQRALDFITNI